MRESSYETFATVMAIVGERAMQGFLAKLDKVREKKIREKVPQDLPPAPAFPASIAGQTQAAAPTSQPQEKPQGNRPSKAKAKPSGATSGTGAATGSSRPSQKPAPAGTSSTSPTERRAKGGQESKPKETTSKQSAEGTHLMLSQLTPQLLTLVFQRMKLPN